MVCSPCHHLELWSLLAKLNRSTDAPVPGTNASTSSADSCAHEAFDLTLGPGKSILHGLALHVAHCHFGHERSSPRQYPRNILTFHNLAACRAPSRECACQDDVHSRLEQSSNAPLLLGHRRARSKPHAFSASVEPKLRPNPLVLLVTIHVAARKPRRTPSGVEVGNIRRRRCRLGEARPTCAGLLLAPLRHADCIERCPLSGVTRKTFAHTEFFSVW